MGCSLYCERVIFMDIRLDIYSHVCYDEHVHVHVIELHVKWTKCLHQQLFVFVKDMK